jgi:hypothetical protein
MSYDLFFIPNGAVPDTQAMANWFETQSHCEIFTTRRERKQAEYDHPLTQTHMLFDLGAMPDPSDPDTPFASAVAFLNLNYMRPLYFADTAADLAAGFMQAFDLHAYDPQENVTLSAPLDKAAFRAAYARQALQAVQALRKAEPDMVPFTKPKADLRAVNDWNLGVQARHDDPDEKHFNPHLQWIRHDGVLGTFFVWGDAVVTHSPRTDFVVMVQDKLAPKRGLFSGRIPWVSILSWDEYVTLCGPALQQDTDGTYFHPWTQAPELTAQVKGFKDKRGMPRDRLAELGSNLISPTAIIDAELLD